MVCKQNHSHNFATTKISATVSTSRHTRLRDSLDFAIDKTLR